MLRGAGSPSLGADRADTAAWAHRAVGWPHDYITFTPHEWDLLAGAARSRAYLASEDVKRNDNPEVSASFQREERIYRDLPARCERLAKEPAQLDLLELPVLRQAP